MSLGNFCQISDRLDRKIKDYEFARGSLMNSVPKTVKLTAVKRLKIFD